MRQRYRADYRRQIYSADCRAPQADGAIVWRQFFGLYGGIAKIDNCRLLNLPPYIAGDMRATVWITGEADTWFSQPAVCWIKGYNLRGYITKDGDGYFVFYKQQIEARGVSEKSSR
jgi:hypothetical protein